MKEREKQDKLKLRAAGVIFQNLFLQVEYFFASDASAIIEHTNRVIYLEDDDVAAVKNGILGIHRLERDQDGKINRFVVICCFFQRMIF